VGDDEGGGWDAQVVAAALKEHPTEGAVELRTAAWTYQAIADELGDANRGAGGISSPRSRLTPLRP